MSDKYNKEEPSLLQKIQKNKDVKEMGFEKDKDLENDKDQKELNLMNNKYTGNDDDYCD